jgi:hypothetical protein
MNRVSFFSHDFSMSLGKKLANICKDYELHGLFNKYCVKIDRGFPFCDIIATSDDQCFICYDDGTDENGIDIEKLIETTPNVDDIYDHLMRILPKENVKNEP